MFRTTVAVIFILAGANHFWHTAIYLRITPPMLPYRFALVFISGAAEIAGGVGLLISPLRTAAGWGLIALLVAVFPANLHMALQPNRFADLQLPTWAFWIRLPLQIVFIAVVWRVSHQRNPRAAGIVCTTL